MPKGWQSGSARRWSRGGGLWRVRYGPYTTRQAAQAGVRAAAAQGFANMPIMAKDEP
ncbi:SPOR domain-containing protein [Sphingobium sp. UBA5915]|nr:SPOR domain-containing protein [Sphingobium sp. UBA5915]MEC9017746.1 SPOR domain-containing protein [Pseudomonadota bacterium]MEE2739791.1 SPOR domain-containing protein [Pseudomonadota bacterium]